MIALASFGWVPVTVPASDTVTLSLDFGFRTEVDVTATFEAQQADGSWALAATATGKPKISVTLPLGATIRMRVDEPTGFYAPGWLKLKSGSANFTVSPNVEEAYVLTLTSGGTGYVDLLAAGAIRGRLVDEQGNPLDGVKVTAWRQLVYGTSFSGTTDADGVVEIKGVHPSEYRLRATDPKARIAGEPFVFGGGPTYSGDRLTVPRAPAIGSFDATLPPGAQISGVVRRNTDGSPVAGAVIECWQYYDNPSNGPMLRVRTVTTAADGSYRVTGLAGVTHELRVGVGWTGPEFPLTTPALPLSAGQLASRDVTLTVGAWLTGSTSIFPTSSWSEAPYVPLSTISAGTYLQANRLNPATGAFVPQLPVTSFSGQLVGGAFRIRIAPGQYRFAISGVNVVPMAFPETPGATIEATAGATVDLGAVSVPRHTIIRGAAQKEAQETWLNSGNVFTLWKKQPDGSFEAVATQQSLDSSGRFRFAGDLSGTFKITGSTPTAGYRTWGWPEGTTLDSAQEFTVARSQYYDMSTKTIRMIAGTLRATVTSLAYDDEGEQVTAPLAGATVVVYKSIGWGPQEVTRLTSGADGSVSAVLPQGAYMLRVIDATGVHSTQEFGFYDGTVQVYADQVTDLGALELPMKGRMGGWVVSEATGGPIAGVQIVPSKPSSGAMAASFTDASGFFETAAMDSDLWDLSVTDPQGRFEPLWFGQMFYPGIGDTEYWEISMEPSEPQIERAAGQNRYASCASAVAKSHACADEIIIATGAAFPDALAGAPLAAATDSPLLLVQPDAIPPVIADEITRLGPTSATVLGGAGSVSDAVVDRLVTLGIPRENIRRIAGSNRFDTAAKIALEVYRLNGWTAEDDVTAYVASGSSFADALTASSVAAMEGAPLLLVSATDVPAATALALDQIQPDYTTIVGGRSVIGDAVANKLKNDRRVAGASRYGTNAALLAETLDRADASGHYYDGLVVASGRTFPDALVGASICGRRNALLVLVDDSLPQTSVPVVHRLGDGAMSLITMGGENAVSTATENAVRSHIR